MDKVTLTIVQPSPAISKPPARPVLEFVPLAIALLLSKWQFWTVMLFPWMKDDPPRWAILFLEVTLSNNTLFPLTYTAPPSWVALQLDNVTLITVQFTPATSRPPPRIVAVLLSKSQFVILVLLPSINDEPPRAAVLFNESTSSNVALLPLT